MGRIRLSKIAAVLGVALLVSSVSFGEPISIAGEWNCDRRSIKQDSFTLQERRTFEFSSEGWYASVAKFIYRYPDGGTFSTSLHIDGLWSVDGDVLVRKISQALVSSWDPSDDSEQDDKVVAKLKREFKTGNAIQTEIRVPDRFRLEILDDTGVVDFVCASSDSKLEPNGIDTDAA